MIKQLNKLTMPHIHIEDWLMDKLNELIEDHNKRFPDKEDDRLQRSQALSNGTGELSEKQINILLGNDELTPGMKKLEEARNDLIRIENGLVECNYYLYHKKLFNEAVNLILEEHKQEIKEKDEEIQDLTNKNKTLIEMVNEASAITKQLKAQKISQESIRWLKDFPFTAKFDTQMKKQLLKELNITQTQDTQDPLDDYIIRE